MCTSIAWQRPTIRRWQEYRERMGSILRRDGHRCAQLVSFSEDIGVEEHLADDTHSQIGHLPININDSSSRPCLLDLLAVMSHDLGVASNVTWLEGWSHKLALMTMKITFATEDAITYRGTKGIMDCLTFVKVIGMFDQN